MTHLIDNTQPDLDARLCKNRKGNLSRVNVVGVSRDGSELTNAVINPKGVATDLQVDASQSLNNLRYVKLDGHDIDLSKTIDVISFKSLFQERVDLNQGLFVLSAVESFNSQSESELPFIPINFFSVPSIIKWKLRSADRGLTNFIDPNTGLKAKSIHYYALFNHNNQIQNLGAVSAVSTSLDQHDPVIKLFTHFACAEFDEQSDLYVLAIAVLYKFGTEKILPPRFFSEYQFKQIDQEPISSQTSIANNLFEKVIKLQPYHPEIDDECAIQYILMNKARLILADCLISNREESRDYKRYLIDFFYPLHFKT